MNFFDYVANINSSKEDLWDINSETEYLPVMVNKALSFHLDTIMHAQQMNHSNCSSHMQYDYLRHAIPKSKKRFTGKWEKELKDEEVELIQEAYKCSYVQAAQYRKLLNNNGISRIKEFLYKGGTHEQ